MRRIATILIVVALTGCGATKLRVIATVKDNKPWVAIEMEDAKSNKARP